MSQPISSGVFFSSDENQSRTRKFVLKLSSEGCWRSRCFSSSRSSDAPTTPAGSVSAPDRGASRRLRGGARPRGRRDGDARAHAAHRAGLGGRAPWCVQAAFGFPARLGGRARRARGRRGAHGHDARGDARARVRGGRRRVRRRRVRRRPRVAGGGARGRARSTAHAPVATGESSGWSEPRAALRLRRRLGARSALRHARDGVALRGRPRGHPHRRVRRARVQPSRLETERRRRRVAGGRRRIRRRERVFRRAGRRARGARGVRGAGGRLRGGRGRRRVRDVRRRRREPEHGGGALGGRAAGGGEARRRAWDSGGARLCRFRERVRFRIRARSHPRARADTRADDGRRALGAVRGAARDDREHVRGRSRERDELANELANERVASRRDPDDPPGGLLRRVRLRAVRQVRRGEEERLALARDAKCAGAVVPPDVSAGGLRGRARAPGGERARRRGGARRALRRREHARGARGAVARRGGDVHTRRVCDGDTK